MLSLREDKENIRENDLPTEASYNLAAKVTALAGVVM